MLVRMRSRSPSSQMPPLGTVLRDEKAVAALSEWIAGDLAALRRQILAATGPSREGLEAHRGGDGSAR
jgi:hypothetical protein